MLLRVHQEQFFGALLEEICQGAELLTDKQRMTIAREIAEALCDFFRQFSISRHEKNLPLTKETKKPALNMITYVRNLTMERLNAIEGRNKIIISGFNERTSDPYAYRSMNVSIELS